MKDKKKKNIKVSIICLAYNHEPYIRKAIDSFINQKTDFEYEIIIHDDASTDNTAKIISEYVEEYSDIITPIYQNRNQYSNNNSIVPSFVFPLVKGRYIAFCEGDDYWTDINKLQKQYDFLECHPECSAVAGVTRYFDDNGRECLNQIPDKKYCNRIINEDEYLNFPKANIGSNTIMARADIMYDQKYLKANKECPKVGDILLMLELFEKGKVFVMPDYFQRHTIQTRNQASNYNSLFGWSEKLLHCTQVVNSVTTNYEKKHDLRKWYNSKLVWFLVSAIKGKEIHEFDEIYNTICKEYRENALLILLRYLPFMVVEKVKSIINK